MTEIQNCEFKPDESRSGYLAESASSDPPAGDQNVADDEHTISSTSSSDGSADSGPAHSEEVND
eukprot:2108391-Amphidinium_carterae.1